MTRKQLRPPRAFVFDLDGTLIDSRDDIAIACNEALMAAGRPALPVATIGTFVGDGARTLIAKAFGTHKDDPAIEPSVRRFLDYYAAHPAIHTRWMAGAQVALEALLGYPVALVTNKPRRVTERVLATMGVGDRFDALVAGGDGPLKPSPEPILSAVRAMGAKPAETWVVGDGSQDVGAGNAAGCFTVAVTGGFHAERVLSEGPDAVIASLHDLLPLQRKAQKTFIGDWR